jgi:hypothetical protein
VILTKRGREHPETRALNRLDVETLTTAAFAGGIRVIELQPFIETFFNKV